MVTVRNVCWLSLTYGLSLLYFSEEELRKLREETNIETLKQELEKERSKRLDLEQKLNLEVLKTR